ncbi:MAG: hypothetical protein NC184_01615 [Roseburia sp.]|nr:hypothetical protein [Roseburia sp.]
MNFAFGERIGLEITNPNNLWKDYDVAALPLNESPLSDKTENGIRIREYYFDGYTTVDGRVRAYIKIAENPTAKGIVLYMPDANGGADDALAHILFENGYTVAMLDYLGASNVQPRFTLYPLSLSSCNCRGKSEFEAPEEAVQSCWYVWTCLARKAIYFLKQLYSGISIFALGVGLGGSTVYKLAAFDDDLIACATFLNVLPKVEGTGNEIINYRAALDNSAYAVFSKIPIMMAVASNDEDGSLDSMAALADSTVSLRCFRIVERAFSRGIKAAFGQIDNFFTDCETFRDDYPRPKITAVNSQNNLYFNISVKQNGTYDSVEGRTTVDKKYSFELFLSRFGDNPTHRNWINIPLVGLGDDKYLAKADTFKNENTIFAFVNMTDGDGNVLSSQLLSVVPKSLGIPSQPIIGQRLIYDGSMKKDVWMSPNGGNVIFKSGLFGIDGITSDSNSLATFKPWSPLPRANADALLQIMVCGKPQTLNITVREEYESYYCQVKISSSENWEKFTLSHLDFKGPVGPLFDWSQAIMLEFTSDEEFIISSVLWV